MNNFLLKEKLWVLSSFPVVGCGAEDRFYGEIVSPSLSPTSMWSSHLPDVSLSLSQTLGFYRGNCSICSSGLIEFMKGGEFMIFLQCYLEPELNLG